MKIALDAMGADRGPSVLVHGAVDAVRDFEMDVILVGDEAVLREHLDQHGAAAHPRLSIVHTPDVVSMADKARDGAKKRTTSVNVAAQLVRDGAAGAFVSVGNTGATKAAATLVLGRLKGIKRPALATLFPTAKEPTLVLDVGATVDCKPEFLHQFAVMGNAYMRDVMQRPEPRVGLLSIGEERGIGNATVTEAYHLLRASHLNFLGNAEGRDIISGRFDVVVCDGFVGNSVLKFGESVASMIFNMLREELKSSPTRKLLASLLRPGFRRFAKKVDWAEWGGAPLLGVNGVCIVGHGSSCERAVKNALRTAGDVLRTDVNRHILAEIERLPEARLPLAAPA